MPQVDEFATALITIASIFKNFFRFKIEEAQAHGAMAHDALKMTQPAAAAVAFFGIESDGDVATFPDTFEIGPAAIADSIANRPYARKLFQSAMNGCHARGDRVGIVGDSDGHVDAANC